MGVSTDAILVYGYNLLDEAMGDEAIEEIEDYYILEKKLEPLGLEIVYHCSDESPMYILGVTASIIRASRGYPESIEELDDFHHKGKDLLRGLEILAIDYMDLSMPKWYLASWWG